MKLPFARYFSSRPLHIRKSAPSLVPSYASPAFVAANELDFACLYSMRRPDLALECARVALEAAIKAGRADLIWRATDLITLLAKGGK